MQQAKHNLLDRANQLVLLCRSADFSANQTVIALADQRDQLADIETYLSSMDVKLVDTKRDLNRLKGMTGRVIDSFRSKCHRKFLFKLLTHIKTNQNSIVKPQRRQVSLKSPEPTNAGSSCAIDGQIDEAFCQIDQLIHILKDKAYTINDQLVEQAGLLDHIHTHAAKSTERVEEQNFDMKKLHLNK